jgi:hypothetical protein
MSVVILGGVYLFTAALYALITKLAVGDRLHAFKAISPGMLPPLAIVFALLVGFLAAQDWRASAEATTEVNREASALRALVLLSREFPGEPEARVHELVRGYIQHAVSVEWPAMARGDATLAIAPPELAEALRLILSLDPQRAGQTIAQRDMMSSLETALDARRHRIILSRASINWVKWVVLLVQAGLTLLTIAMVHADNRLANRTILAVFATGVGAAIVLIAAHGRPFTGDVAVTPTVLLQVMPEAGP